MSIAELEAKTKGELLDMAKGSSISGASSLKKQDLIYLLLQAQLEKQGATVGSGILETMNDGYGFLRQESFTSGPNDIYISQSQIRRFALRSGDAI
ncbi:MAG: Rho termination factor N-terminal domain-containing protein, partial [Dehalococcoidia bacterium]|nr:Rho termination factor N-terminal domain-containing protein [Dehalococcoidia bacterium]